MRLIVESSPSRLSHRNDATKSTFYNSADYDSDQNSSGLMKSDSMEFASCVLEYKLSDCKITITITADNYRE